MENLRNVVPTQTPNFTLPKIPGNGSVIVPLLNVDDIFQAELAVIQNTSPGDTLYIDQYSLPSLGDGPPIATPGSQAQRELLPSLVNQIHTNHVQSYVIADNSAAAPPQEERPHNQSTITFLHRNGAYVLPYPKNYVSINHTKFLANQNYAVITSANMSKHQSDAPYDNTGFLLAGAAVKTGVQQTFSSQWNFSVEQDALGWASAYPPLRLAAPALSDDKIRWLNTAPKEESNADSDRIEIKKKYDDLIWRAGNPETGRSLFFEHFDLSNIELALRAIHAKQNNPALDARFILDPNQYLQGLSQGHHDPRVVAYHILIGAQIPVRFAKVDPHPPTADSRQIFHAKWCVFNEDEILNGSANLSASSLNGALHSVFLGPHHHNREVDVWIKDATIAKIFKAKFLDDWENRATIDPVKAAENKS